MTFKPLDWIVEARDGEDPTRVQLRQEGEKVALTLEDPNAQFPEDMWASVYLNSEELTKLGHALIEAGKLTS